MSSDAADLWRNIYGQFSHHQGPTDPTPRDAMNRIAQKCLYLASRSSLGPENCTVRLVQVTKRELHDLRTFHCRPNGYPSLEPIVALEWNGHRVVIEGNTRTNRWRTTDGEGPFPVILVTPAAA
jgi:hypothetical protein